LGAGSETLPLLRELVLMTTHEEWHSTLRTFKARVVQNQAIVDDPASDYNARGVAQARLEMFLRPRYANALRDHLLVDHNCETIEPWPFMEELEAAHEQCHS
jgi:hypothetical protein